MMSRFMSRLLATGLLALLAVVPAADPTAAEGRKVAVVAFGLFGDQSVFESEAKGAAGIVAKRFGADPVVVRANTKKRSDATVETLAATLDAVAKKIDPENDLLVVILTTHGSRGGLAVKAGPRQEMLSPALLSNALRHTGVRHRMVIISACYSGIFLPLADPDTLVITAADANHPSFGCQDGARWTYFGDAFFNNALRHAANPKAAFGEARELVRKRELRNGFEPSNPQIAGGENIDLQALTLAAQSPNAGDSQAGTSAQKCAPKCPKAAGSRRN
jgi:Peptidase C13 family